MKAHDRARIAVRFDLERLDQPVVPLFELNAFRALDAMDEMAAIARDEMQLESAFVVADAAQLLLLDLTLIAAVLGYEFERGRGSLVNTDQGIEEGLVSIGGNRACLHRGPPHYSMHFPIQKELQNIDGIDIDR